MFDSLLFKITFPRFLAKLNISHMPVYEPYFLCEPCLCRMPIYLLQSWFSYWFFILFLSHLLWILFSIFVICPFWSIFPPSLPTQTFFKHRNFQFYLVKLVGWVFFPFIMSVISRSHPPNLYSPTCFIFHLYFTLLPMGKKYVLSACSLRTYFHTFRMLSNSIVP